MKYTIWESIRLAAKLLIGIVAVTALIMAWSCYEVTFYEKYEHPTGLFTADTLSVYEGYYKAFTPTDEGLEIRDSMYVRGVLYPGEFITSGFPGIAYGTYDIEFRDSVVYTPITETRVRRKKFDIP